MGNSPDPSEIMRAAARDPGTRARMEGQAAARRASGGGGGGGGGNKSGCALVLLAAVVSVARGKGWTA